MSSSRVTRYVARHMSPQSPQATRTLARTPRTSSTPDARTPGFQDLTPRAHRTLFSTPRASRGLLGALNFQDSTLVHTPDSPLTNYDIIPQYFLMSPDLTPIRAEESERAEESVSPENRVRTRLVFGDTEDDDNDENEVTIGGVAPPDSPTGIAELVANCRRRVLEMREKGEEAHGEKFPP